MGITLALLAVSKTLHREASKVLYGLNTYQARIELDIDQAIDHQRVQEAIKLLRLRPNFDPPESGDLRDRYIHPDTKLIRRLEVQLRPKVAEGPHRYGQYPPPARSDISEIYSVFIKHCRLDLCIFSTRGFGSTEDWLPAALFNEDHAVDLLLAMWSFHEWHFEKVLLAAASSTGTIWVNDISYISTVDLAKSIFHPDLREITLEERKRALQANQVTRILPRHFQLGLRKGRLRDKAPYNPPQPN